MSRHEFSSYQEAYQLVIEYIRFYNERRIHGSPYNFSPCEFRQQLGTGELKPLIVKVEL